MQLTHGGSFSETGLAPGGRTVAPSSIFNPAGFNWPDEMTAADMVRYFRQENVPGPHPNFFFFRAPNEERRIPPPRAHDALDVCCGALRCPL